MRLALCLCIVTAHCAGQEVEDYVFGFLRAHPERTTLPEAEVAAIQKAHLAHLDRMADDGHLVGAGPLIESPDLRGVLIFRGITIQRARDLASQDPAVIHKRLRVHVEEWKSTKGIGEVLAKGLRNPNFQVKMTRYGFSVYRPTPGTIKDWNSVAAKDIRKEQSDWLKSNASRVVLSGQFSDRREFLGVSVFQSTDLEEVRKLVADEPFVKAGWARPELFVWMVAEGVIPEPDQR